MKTIRRHPDRLFELMPSLYRIADAGNNNELRALLRLITSEADALRDNVEQLWDDYFIETCQRWVVPYIGDLVGNIPLHDLDVASAAATAQSLFADLAGPDLRPRNPIRLRADVAKTIYYRRRKGTTPMLEELARDVTGWDAHIVEFFTLLDWNQHLEHLRLDCHGCPDLRRIEACTRVGGAWDTATHTVDVRHINEWDGWYNIPNIGFFLWRLSAFPIERVTPRDIGGTNWRLTFSPLGNDTQMFGPGRREANESQVATELHVEAPIRPAAFFEDLRRVPLSPPAAPTPSTDYYGELINDRSVVVYADGAAINANEIECANLVAWTAMAQPAGMRVQVDISRGRLVVPTGRAGQAIAVAYHYGFSMEMGGGQYPRAKWLVREPAPIVVVGGGAALDNSIAARPVAPRTVVEVRDNASYLLATNITLAAGETLTLQAADGFRPHVQLANGAISILSAGPGGSLTLSGLLVEGGLRIDDDLERLRLVHTTLVPGRSVEQEVALPPSGPSLVVSANSGAGAPINRELNIEIAFCIVGALRIPEQCMRLMLLDSIVLGIERLGGPRVAAVSNAAGDNGPPVHVERSTLFGPVFFLKIELASESIFTDPIEVEQRQAGCLRFSFVPLTSHVPQQYRCQPSLEIAREQERVKAEALTSGTPLPPGWEAAVSAQVAAWLLPAFQTDVYGRADLAQLRLAGPQQIATGAADGSEMGAFCVLKQPQRAANLRLRLDEYLPVGLEAGFVFAN
jgi:hypothetical protein